MPKSTTGLASPLREQLDRLASFEPTSLPVLSLYLDLRPDQQGRENHGIFLRKVFAERTRTLTGNAKDSFERDAARIREYLDTHVAKSVNAVAIFACAANDFF